MKNIKTPFLVTLALMVMLASTHLYLVNAQTSTNSCITSCSEAQPTPIASDNILKIEINPSNTANAINKSWLYISPAANKELNKIVSESKNKNIAFSIYVAGYG